MVSPMPPLGPADPMRPPLLLSGAWHGSRELVSDKKVGAAILDQSTLSFC